MRLSTLGRYALRAMVDLALHEDRGPVLRKDIVARQEISSNYLAHLCGKLKQAGLIKSVMGPGGGYVLACNATDISAGDVLRAVDEILEPVFCVDVDPRLACPRADSCVTHLLWAQLGRHIIELLDSVTLAELCEQSRFLTSTEREVADGSTETGGRRAEWRSRQLGDFISIDGAGI
jgi:Rrf2 family protein